MKNSHRIIIACLATVVVMRSIDYMNRMGPLWAAQHFESTFVSAETDDADAFEKQVRDACYQLIETEGEYKSKPLPRYRSVWSYLTRDRLTTGYGYGEYALLMHYSFLYAKQKNDVSLIKLIQKKFDEGFRVGGVIVERQDQIAYGNVAIDLYKWSSDVYYKQFADKLYSRLDSIDNIDGLVLYREGTTEQHVDAIGLVCPFLYYYANTFDCDRAQGIGRKMCEEYVRWGTDNITGIPVQTYNIQNHVKLNHVNWGRGISWYLMGIKDLVSSDSIVNSSIKLIEETLLTDTDHLYNQYFSQGNFPDMSATIPVLYYLKEKNLLNLTKMQLTELISKYCDQYSLVRYCSPSISYPHDGVSTTIGSLQSQAILLYMLSL